MACRDCCGHQQSFPTHPRLQRPDPRSISTKGELCPLSCPRQRPSNSKVPRTSNFCQPKWLAGWPCSDRGVGVDWPRSGQFADRSGCDSDQSLGRYGHDGIGLLLFIYIHDWTTFDLINVLCPVPICVPGSLYLVPDLFQLSCRHPCQSAEMGIGGTELTLLTTANTRWLGSLCIHA